MEKTKCGKGTKIIAIINAGGGVLSVTVKYANPPEVTLVERNPDRCFLNELSQRLDKAYDSDVLDERLAKQGIEMISTHKDNRKKNKTQDGRKLRRCNRRWKVKRFFAWLLNYIRCIVRHENKKQNFQAVVLLASIMIFLKSFFSFMRPLLINTKDKRRNKMPTTHRT